MPYANNGMTSRASRRATGDAVAKSARTASGASAWLDIGDVRELVMQLQSDAGTGTAPTLDVKLQTSFDGTDANAIDVPTGSFTQVTTGASNQIKAVTVFHPFIKVIWTIAGTTPSFNFGVYLTGKE